MYYRGCVKEYLLDALRADSRDFKGLTGIGTSIYKKGCGEIGTLTN